MNSWNAISAKPHSRQTICSAGIGLRQLLMAAMPEYGLLYFHNLISVCIKQTKTFFIWDKCCHLTLCLNLVELIWRIFIKIRGCSLDDMSYVDSV